MFEGSWRRQTEFMRTTISSVALLTQEGSQGIHRDRSDDVR